MSDLAAICGECRRVVADGDGYLCVRFGDIRRYWSEKAEWEEAHPGSMHRLAEILTMPDEITWRVYHVRCDPLDGLDSYQIDVERIRTWRQLARWTSDLMAKNWLAHSDWDHLLRGIADDRGTRLVAVQARAA